LPSWRNIHLWTCGLTFLPIFLLPSNILPSFSYPTHLYPTISSLYTCSRLAGRGWVGLLRFVPSSCHLSIQLPAAELGRNGRHVLRRTACPPYTSPHLLPPSSLPLCAVTTRAVFSGCSFLPSPWRCPLMAERVNRRRSGLADERGFGALSLLCGWAFACAASADAHAAASVLSLRRCWLGSGRVVYLLARHCPFSRRGRRVGCGAEEPLAATYLLRVQPFPTARTCARRRLLPPPPALLASLSSLHLAAAARRLCGTYPPPASPALRWADYWRNCLH